MDVTLATNSLFKWIAGLAANAGVDQVTAKDTDIKMNVQLNIATDIDAGVSTLLNLATRIEARDAAEQRILANTVKKAIQGVHPGARVARLVYPVAAAEAGDTAPVSGRRVEMLIGSLMRSLDDLVIDDSKAESNLRLSGGDF